MTPPLYMLLFQVYKNEKMEMQTAKNVSTFCIHAYTCAVHSTRYHNFSCYTYFTQNDEKNRSCWLHPCDQTSHLHSFSLSLCISLTYSMMTTQLSSTSLQSPSSHRESSSLHSLAFLMLYEYSSEKETIFFLTSTKEVMNVISR